MVSTLIPLGLTPESARLAEVAAGMIWVMALLATLLSVDGLFASDYQDGSLEQLLITPQLLPMPLLGKITAHWLTTGLPLTLVSPLLGLMLSLPASGYLPMICSLASGHCLSKSDRCCGSGFDRIPAQGRPVVVAASDAAVYASDYIWHSHSHLCH